MDELLFFALSYGATFFIVVAIWSLMSYFIPSIIAAARGHKDTMGITILNIFLGWTLLGWVVALVWSVTGNNKPLANSTPPLNDARLVQCNHCSEMIDRRVKVCYFCNNEQWPNEQNEESKASKIAKALTSV